MRVYTYICVVKLEKAIQSEKFTSQKHKAALNILYTAWWLKTLISKELKAIGLTHEQFNVLRILKGKHPEKMCVKDIGVRMIERNSNVPRIVDRLVAKKFVERSTSEMDKRETVITLTYDGMDILKNAIVAVDHIFTNNVVIKEADAERLNSLLESIRKRE